MTNRTCSIEGCTRPRRKREWCNTHYERWRLNGDPLASRPRKTADPRTRFEPNVQKQGDGCWIWTGRQDGDGYGQFWLDGKHRRAFVVSYEMNVGPVPEGLELDHLCRVRLCVNPAHLEPVTTQVNQLRGNGVSGINARKTHCDHGHEFTPANTYITPDGRRQCRTCQRERSRRHQRR